MLKHLLREPSQISPGLVRQIAQVSGLAKDCNVRNFTTSSSSICLPLMMPVYMMWGANTDVGKTLVSAGLAAATKRRKVRQRDVACKQYFRKPERVYIGVPAEAVDVHQASTNRVS